MFKHPYNEQSNLSTEIPDQAMQLMIFVAFLERGADFTLVKRSPYYDSKSGRPDVGSSYNTPNFTNLIQVLIAILQSEQFKSVPLREEARNLLLHKEFIRVAVSCGCQPKLLG